MEGVSNDTEKEEERLLFLATSPGCGFLLCHSPEKWGKGWGHGDTEGELPIHNWIPSNSGLNRRVVEIPEELYSEWKRRTECPRPQLNVPRWGCRSEGRRMELLHGSLRDNISPILLLSDQDPPPQKSMFPPLRLSSCCHFSFTFHVSEMENCYLLILWLVIPLDQFHFWQSSSLSDGGRRNLIGNFFESIFASWLEEIVGGR